MRGLNDGFKKNKKIKRENEEKLKKDAATYKNTSEHIPETELPPPMGLSELLAFIAIMLKGKK